MAAAEPETRTLLAVRIRGAVRIRKGIEKTFQLLGLRYKYNAVLLPNDPSTKGMLFAVKDLITWGEIDRPALTNLILKRGCVRGKGRLDEKLLQTTLNFKDASEMADAILTGTTPLHHIYQKGLQKVFRLHPPKGGFKHGTKRPFHDRGELGYRGAAINQLVERMT